MIDVSNIVLPLPNPPLAKGRELDFLVSPLTKGRAVSFPKRVKIARVKQIKMEDKSTLRRKNFGVFSPKYLIFLCVFAPLREIILLTNLQHKRMKQPCLPRGD
jgi:hypothetical protein